MLLAYATKGAALERVTVEPGAPIPHKAIWFDLISPTPEEDRLVEAELGIALPTREEMQEIEPTSRLYVENGARYMTATLMHRSETEAPGTTPVTFVLSGHRLVTVRYEDPRPFTVVANKLCRAYPADATGETVLMDLLDALIDRTADILERIGAAVDRVSHDIFEPEGTSDGRSKRYEEILQAIGRRGDLSSKVRESLVSIGRLLLYLTNEADTMAWPKEMRAQLRGMQRDVQSLSHHVDHVSSKIQFLLDALLGVVTIEQNRVVQIFSVAAVILLPPSLVATIFGMNFKHMPELEWDAGYPLGLLLILLSAVLPYLFFKWKKWL